MDNTNDEDDFIRYLSSVPKVNEGMSMNEKLELLQLLEEREKRLNFSGHRKWFLPDTPYSIDNLPKQRAYFEAGAKYRFRLLIGGNRVGKTQCTTFEAAVHATGEYPDWWTGRRFNHPPLIWVAGDTNNTLKDILQVKLLGGPGARGTGMLPLDSILGTQAKQGVSGGIGAIQVRHKPSGGVSNIILLSYQQGVETFYGQAVDAIFLDEEPPELIYNEASMRLMTTGGFLSLSFTPLKGYTSLITRFFQYADLLEGAKPLEGSELLFDKKVKPPEKPYKAVVQIGWDNAPWLSEDAKEELIRETPPSLRAARSQGIPTYGEGSAFPIAQDQITYRPGDIQIKDEWKHLYGLDVGWQVTCAIFAAYDETSDTVYIYDEYYGEQALPSLHAFNIRSRGPLIPGAIDPASLQSGQDDGKTLMDQYKKEGLRVDKAINARKAGYANLWQRMVTGKLKVATTCKRLLAEIVRAQVDDKGELKRDHSLHGIDALRYAAMSVGDKGKPKQSRPSTAVGATKGYFDF